MDGLDLEKADCSHSARALKFADVNSTRMPDAFRLAVAPARSALRACEKPRPSPAGDIHGLLDMSADGPPLHFTSARKVAHCPSCKGNVLGM
ncbi:hypothetical protein MPTK1_5g10540 [Marchantia polymorpha subsp. ruderalis]|uniref:Uncharacterized protein n=2 Tax=Marchantia polymorpha TaxID=3197 RepID=A0AAF6BGZ7_MARPO|nr:hypothetical protein MARPO_0048s0018 [Marchantia polymorpha]BBN11281.1 hypothetical protein Mp_5g10540 [Marchantia polymorpha subsp. ruderalis]|eukprot:PTQ38890.1 hypothetical protein MARPO_0048s0018 [Marchantia polymorpha]